MTFSGLLNALDGLASQEGRVLIMTSNNPDDLDKALIRPGRVDKQVHFDLISQQNAESIFIRMYTKDPVPMPNIGALDTAESSGEEDNDLPEKVTSEVCTQDVTMNELRALAQEFAAKVPPNSMTPAEVQGFLLENKHSPSAAVEGIEQFHKDLQEQEERREEYKRQTVLGKLLEEKNTSTDRKDTKAENDS